MLGPLAKLTWVVLAAALWAATCACAEVTVTAEVDSDVVTTDDIIDLTVSVSGSTSGSPQLPALSGFRLIATSTRQSITLIGADLQSVTNHVYSLQPLKPGKLTIGPVRFKGQVTAPITVTVMPGSRGRTNQPLVPPTQNPFTPGPMEQISPRDAARVKQSVSHRTAYVGQQITYTFSFLQADQLYGEVEYSPADMPGFVAETLPNPPQSTEMLEGRVHQVQRRQKALFATTPGKHSIGQASVSVATDPVSGPEDLVAKPITVNVLPLPTAGQPAGYGGAVGHFRVTVAVDRQAVRAGETVTCTVEVRGDGNIRSLGAPQLRLPDTARLYKAGERRNTSAGGGGGGPSVMGGTATFSFLVLPKQAGTLTIPSVDYPYFDPDARAYRIARSQPVKVEVTPGSALAGSQPLPTNGLQPLRETLGHPVREAVTGRLWFWVLLALPLLVVLWAGWRRWQEVRLIADPLQARSGNAQTLARRRLDLACRSLAAGDADACYAELNSALADYVADRTGAPPSGLTADMAYDLLCRHGAQEPLAARARELLSRTAAGRFAPGAAVAGNAEALADACRELVAELQRQVRPPHDA